jgi:DNA mismatch endonuclease (patch repair protein)
MQMTDSVPAHVRSRMMSSIKGKDTKPELLIRSGLHRLGFRFRLHVRGLPGRPDLVLPRRRAAIFVNGCFWHGHNCGLFKIPASRTQFWTDKILANQARDSRSIRLLKDDGWRVATVWECAIRRRGDTQIRKVLERLSAWLNSKRRQANIRAPSDNNRD